MEKGTLVHYLHSPKCQGEAIVIKRVGENKVQIRILADYTPFTKRILDPDDWFRTRSYPDPSTMKKTVLRDTVKTVSLDRIDAFDLKRMLYYPKDQVFRSPEFNTSFQNFLLTKDK